MPTSFTLNISRNLSASWFRDRPDLEVSGKINAINVSCDEISQIPLIKPIQLFPQINLLASDYGLLMDILNRNLKEGSGERNVLSYESELMALEPKPEADPDDNLEVAEVAPTTTVEPAGGTKIGTFLKFAFTMDSLVISLFTDENVGLATCGIYTLSVKGSILANGSINVSLILYDIQLDDIREERKNTLTRYMGRKVDRSDKDKSMIDITCSLKGNSTFADIRISGFDLIISMDFLMKLSSFAAAPADKSKPIQGPKAVAPVQAQPVDILNAEQKQMNVTITIEQPDIILMEKMDGKPSNALILNFEMNVKLRREGCQQNIMGDMQNFNIHMCEFDLNNRDTMKYYIIRPVSISINGSTPDNCGLKVAVVISDINISISPLILEVVNRIVAQTTANSDVKEEVKAIDYSDIWSPQPFNEQDHWFTQVETALEAANILKSAPAEKLNEICTLEMPALVLKIETGFGNHTIPMLRLASKMHVNVRNWSSQIAVEGSLELGVSYYNSTLALWEPLLEPNEIQTPNGVARKNPWVLNLGINLEENMDEITNGEWEESTRINYFWEIINLSFQSFTK